MGLKRLPGQPPFPRPTVQHRLSQRINLVFWQQILRSITSLLSPVHPHQHVGDVIRRLLDGVKPGWESDLRTARERHACHVAGGSDRQPVLF